MRKAESGNRRNLAANCQLTTDDGQRTTDNCPQRKLAVNPLDELHKLTGLFPEQRPLIEAAEHVATALVPEPYRAMLVHGKHMTVTMERYYGCPVDVRILDRCQDDDVYSRKILLLKSGTDRVVQFGIVRFDLGCVTEETREEILKGETPLGRVLINRNVLRHIDLGAVLRITAGPLLAEYMNIEPGSVTYGRLATIFCNRQPAVDLLEIAAPLASPPIDGPAS